MSQPIAIWHEPKAALGACIMAAAERDTRGCTLTDAQRFNYYPATPLVVISWVFEGVLHMVEDVAPHAPVRLGAPVSRLVLSGPQHRPSVSWSPGPVHALSAGFYPEAFGRLIGQPVASLLNRNVPLHAVAPSAFLLACQSVFECSGQQAFSQLQTQLQRLWDGPGQARATPFLGDWVRTLAARATGSLPKGSLRQHQRRVRHWTGQSLRDLELFTRGEAALARYLASRRGELRDLASVAAEAGFADQSHMGRDLRRLTGFSPARLGARMASDEAFWFYRLVAQRA